MNVKELNEKYQRIQNWQDEYRKELISYINEAFAMHGNEFVLKPDGCDTWVEADDIDEGLDAMERIPTYLIIYDKHSDSHEIYPTKIYRHEGGCTEYVNGYDYGECTFTEGWEADSDMESLQAIATFINAVLEQEADTEETRQPIGYQLLDENDNIPDGLFSFQVFRAEQDAKDFMAEKNLSNCTIAPIYEGDVEDPTFIGKNPRTFKKGERVFNCEYSGGDRDLYDWATVCSDTEVEYDDDIVLIEMENGGENETIAGSLYQLAEGKVCPRCGGPLCIEHDDEIDYPYFCPECDENFYNIEVQ